MGMQPEWAQARWRTETMNGLWIPRENPAPRFERPFLEAPSPFEYYPSAPPEKNDEVGDEDAPRVIIIDI